MRLSKAAVQALLQGEHFMFTTGVLWLLPNVLVWTILKSAVSKNNTLAVCNHSPPTQKPLRERIVQSSSATFCSAEDLLSEAIKGYKKSEGITWNNYKETKEKSW